MSGSAPLDEVDFKAKMSLPLSVANDRIESPAGVSPRFDPAVIREIREIRSLRFLFSKGSGVGRRPYRSFKK